MLGTSECIELGVNEDNLLDGRALGAPDGAELGNTEANISCDVGWLR